jgi:glycolate oxidase iron-sulfur subunit
MLDGGMLREINFATVRVLIENNVQVIIPQKQGCCGAFQEHMGFEGVEELRDQNRDAFLPLDVDAVLSNSSGCGYALGKALGNGKPVIDVLRFLAVSTPSKAETKTRARNSMSICRAISSTAKKHRAFLQTF